ncbi:MAG: hypothetical protein AAB657_02400 [Patescibacteria group bacterium]
MKKITYIIATFFLLFTFSAFAQEVKEKKDKDAEINPAEELGEDGPANVLESNKNQVLWFGIQGVLNFDKEKNLLQITPTCGGEVVSIVINTKNTSSKTFIKVVNLDMDSRGNDITKLLYLLNGKKVVAIGTPMRGEGGPISGTLNLNLFLLEYKDQGKEKGED